MKSIRVWLFGLFPLIAIASMIATDFRSSLVATNDWRDLSINGRGYIETVDGNGENPLWARSVRLGVNQFGLLCANVKGSLRPFEPPIHVQSGWTRIEIDTNGQIKIGTPGSSEISIGSISLTMFFGEDVNESIQLENPDDRLGPPMVVEPGSSGAGYPPQKWVRWYFFIGRLPNAEHVFQAEFKQCVAGCAKHRVKGSCQYLHLRLARIEP